MLLTHTILPRFLNYSDDVATAKSKREKKGGKPILVMPPKSYRSEVDRKSAGIIESHTKVNRRHGRRSPSKHLYSSTLDAEPIERKQTMNNRRQRSSEAQVDSKSEQPNRITEDKIPKIQHSEANQIIDQGFTLMDSTLHTEYLD